MEFYQTIEIGDVFQAAGLLVMPWHLEQGRFRYGNHAPGFHQKLSPHGRFSAFFSLRPSGGAQKWLTVQEFLEAMDWVEK